MGTVATKTLRVRIRDKHIPLLRRMAREVNTVWNYCNQASKDHWRKHRRHLTGFDLNKLCTGSSPAFGLIGDSTIQEVGQHYASKRKRFGQAQAQVACLQPKTPQLLPRVGTLQEPRSHVQERHRSLCRP